jgi:hypothetical protein
MVQLISESEVARFPSALSAQRICTYIAQIRRLWIIGCVGRKISGFLRAGTSIVGRAGLRLDFIPMAKY